MRVCATTCYVVEEKEYSAERHNGKALHLATSEEFQLCQLRFGDICLHPILTGDHASCLT